MTTETRALLAQCKEGIDSKIQDKARIRCLALLLYVSSVDAEKA
jgi:hypothetical protein